MTKTIKIQSEGDLITNSSTEVFTVINEDTIKSIRDIVVLLAEEEYANQFEYYLDWCEVIEDRAGEIADLMRYDSVEVPEHIDSGSSNKEAWPFACSLIKSVMPEKIWRKHYQNSKDINNIEKAEDLECADYIKENIERLCLETNEGHDWMMFPNVVIIPKNPNNEKDKKVAETLMHLPFLCDHSATYC